MASLRPLFIRLFQILQKEIQKYSVQINIVTVKLKYFYKKMNVQLNLFYKLVP